MPRGDGTGPFGYGAKTGWATGFCKSGFLYPLWRWIWNRSFCYRSLETGGVWRHWHYGTEPPFWPRWFYRWDLAAEDAQKYEAEILSQRARLLKEELRMVEERLEKLKGIKKESLEEKDQKD